MTEPAVEIRESVGPYRLIRAIGAGGSARVDLARLERAYGFQRHVVLKRPLEHLRADPAVAASLQREARIGGRLNHPNLVSVLDAGSHDGYDYLVLEYIHGASLRTLMQTEVGAEVRDIPLPVALGIVIDVARGMHEAHALCDETGRSLGLVHRDVSPGNVLLGHDGSVKLADFGIAKETHVATLSGSMHGTVTYMAPEQCRGHAFDRRADVFSLGVILYELTTHRRLFLADNDVASLHRVLSGQVTRPRKVNPALSAALEDIVMTAVAHDANRRFATAWELAEALQGVAASERIVLGARWLARTLEEVVGAKDAPWITGTRVMQIPEATDVPSEGEVGFGRETSLISVIESLPAADSEPGLPTFGPSESEPTREAAPRPMTATRGLLAVGAFVTAVAAFAIVSDVSRDPTAPNQPHDRSPAAGAPVTPTPQAAAPPPTIESPPVEPPPVEPPVPIATHRHHSHPAITPHNPSHGAPAATRTPRSTVGAMPRPAALPNGSAVRSTTAVAAPEPPATPPVNVEWKPTLLLPSDSGSAGRMSK